MSDSKTDSKTDPIVPIWIPSANDIDFQRPMPLTEFMENIHLVQNLESTLVEMFRKMKRDIIHRKNQDQELTICPRFIVINLYKHNTLFEYEDVRYCKIQCANCSIQGPDQTYKRFAKIFIDILEKIHNPCRNKNPKSFFLPHILHVLFNGSPEEKQKCFDGEELLTLSDVSYALLDVNTYSQVVSQMKNWFRTEVHLENEIPELAKNRANLMLIFQHLCHFYRRDFEKMSTMVKNFQNYSLLPPHLQRFCGEFVVHFYESVCKASCSEDSTESFAKFLLLIGQFPMIPNIYIVGTVLENKNPSFKTAYIVLSERPVHKINELEYYPVKSVRSPQENFWMISSRDELHQKDIQRKSAVLDPCDKFHDAKISDDETYVFKFVQPLQELISTKPLTAKQISILCEKYQDLIDSFSGSDDFKFLADYQNQIVVVRDREICSSENLMDSHKNYSLKVIAHYRDPRVGDCMAASKPTMGAGLNKNTAPEVVRGHKLSIGSMHFTFGFFFKVMIQLATNTSLRNAQVDIVEKLMANDPQTRERCFHETYLTEESVQKILDKILRQTFPFRK